MSSGVLKDYMGYGTLAARPSTPSVGPGVSAMYRATDVGHTYSWDGSAWIQIDGGLSNPMTTQDDIIVGGASGVPARLGKGSDGQVLTVDPTTHHLLWATPGGALTQIGSIAPLGSTAAAMTFSSISGAYNGLLLVHSLRLNGVTNYDTVIARFNADSGANYDYTQQLGNEASPMSNSGALAATSIAVAGGPGGSNVAANTFGSGQIWIPFYASTANHKPVNTASGFKYGTTHIYATAGSGVWHSTAAITSIVLTPSSGSFEVGSSAILYGVN